MTSSAPVLGITLVLSVFTTAATGCVLGTESDGGGTVPANDGSKKTLLTPTSDAKKAAGDFQTQFPSTRIFFSQNTGDLLWLDGNGGTLAHGLIDTPEHALSVVQTFMASHPGLYRITDPTLSLGIKVGDFVSSSLGSGVASLHFEQLESGVAIKGRHGTAFFDGDGNLLGLQTQLLPSAAFAPAAEMTAQNVAAVRAQAVRIDSPNRVSRPLWHKAPGAGAYLLIDEQIEQRGIQTIRTLRESVSGQLLETIDETPSDWVAAPAGWNQLPNSSFAARTTLGQALSIPSTQAPGALVLGFHLPGIHAPGMSANVGDAGSSGDPANAPVTPIATTASDWLSDPDYDSKLRAASTLALNLAATLQWYKQNLNWSSWDNKGTMIFTGVRGNRTGTPKPQLNAWGGGGMILIGDGPTPTGQPLSDALDVVAHEFTHSVIYATGRFIYNSESGALNESLADIFGKTVQNFPDVIVGSQAGVHFRDLSDPENCVSPDGTDCTQPGKYSQYKIIALATDAGGVHTNSGIVNKVLMRVIQASPASGSAAKGLADRGRALISLILDSMQQAGFDPGLALEEFAAGLSAYCEARERAGSLAPNQTGMCTQLESAFREGELLVASP